MDGLETIPFMIEFHHKRLVGRNTMKTPLFSQCNTSLTRSLLVLVISLVSSAYSQNSPSASGVALLSAPQFQIHAGLPDFNSPGTPLSDLLRKAHPGADLLRIPWNGLDVHISDTVPGPVNDSTIARIYQNLSCLADVIAVGHVNMSLPHISASGTTVYSDYDFAIDTLVKDKTLSLRAGTEIVVTRLGGTLALTAGAMKYDSLAFPVLQTSLTYLQFLRLVSQSGGYEALDAFATLSASGDNWSITRTAFSTTVFPGLGRSIFLPAISGWLAACK